MNNDFLEKYIIAQKRDYKTALNEIKNSKKTTHWMWYIFPQIHGLGQSYTSKYYSLKSLEEAKLYLSNSYLKNNLINICEELLKSEELIIDILGYPDNFKLCSSMTLFYLAEPEYIIFKKVIDKFFDGILDEKTVEILEKERK